MIDSRFWLLGSLAAVPFALISANPSPQIGKKLEFAQDVLPILKAHCASCHAGESPSGGLSLETVQGLLKGGVSGRAVIPGKSSGSLIVKRLNGDGGLPRMPMGFAPLSSAQIAAIRNWIDQGASTQGSSSKHWAYVKPSRPSIPKMRIKNWARNPIDAFVLERLERARLKPSREAPKAMLLRRVYLDLVGVPPSPAELDAFLKDKSRNAYEKVVDRLLASPHFGERQAREWLDLARFADSNGFEKDNNRVMYKYRDWVIQAYNANMPYDQFVVKQLAGDLLPNSTQDDLIATGFHRNTMFNQEGGVDPEEGLFEALIDRVSTTGVVFSGVTFGCARCHDHKYDPVKQREFYQLLAFFSGTEYTPKGDANVGEQKYYEPEIEVPTPEQTFRRAALRSKIARLAALTKSLRPELRAEFAAWELLAKEGSVWTPFDLVSASAKGGAAIGHRPDGALEVSGPVPDRNTYRLTLKLGSSPITGIRLEAIPNGALPNQGPGRADNGNFLLSRIRFLTNGKSVPVAATAADFEQRDFPIRNALDGDPASGWGISPNWGKPHEAVFEFEEPLTAGKGELEAVLEFEGPYDRHALGCFRLSATSSSHPAARLVRPELRQILESPNRNPADQEKLAAYFLGVTPSLKSERSQLERAETELAELQSQIGTALVLRDKPGPLQAYFRNRGEFLNKGEIVRPGVPAAWNPMPKGVPNNRLGLAKWIASKDNPLTARVEVNRIWERYFGRGLVETSENFGTQGAKPTHPKLLDWLASEFMASGWNMKAIHRLIVTSATYRQTSAASPDLVKRDLSNELLTRGPRFRMEAEMVRDNALAIAGLLSPKIGGPSVYPPQPDGVWNTPYNGQRWMTSQADDKYRRGLYTFIKRTSPYPAFITFDATSRETCTVRRIRTNTPLQALTLMNDPAFLEAARALADRMAKAPAKKPEDRLVYGFRLCTCRFPSPEELTRLSRLVNDLQSRYAKDPKAAAAIAGTPQQAARVMVASVLLNLDETITKD